MKHISKLIKCALNDYRLVVGKIKSPAACVGVGVVVVDGVDGVDGVGIVGVVIVLDRIDGVVEFVDGVIIADLVTVVILIANDVFVAKCPR